MTSLLAQHRPLTAEEIAHECRLPLSTSYRLLTDLVESGITVRVPGATRTDRFELSERFTDRHHHHLVCHRCGSVTDFDPSPALERAIHSELDSIGEGFAADHHIFDVHGVCAECAASDG
jgi:Fur family ferric uptake transcriptional regulator